MPSKAALEMFSTVKVSKFTEPLLLELPPVASRLAKEAADKLFREFERELWASKGASGGAPWKELNPRYKQWKAGSRKRDRAIGRKKTSQGLHRLMSTEILVQYGAMRQAFSTLAQGHIAEVALNPKKITITLGARGPKYWDYHRKGEGNNPKRNPIQRTKDQDKMILIAVQEAIAPFALAAVRASFKRKGV